MSTGWPLRYLAGKLANGNWSYLPASGCGSGDSGISEGIKVSEQQARLLLPPTVAIWIGYFNVDPQLRLPAPTR